MSPPRRVADACALWAHFCAWEGGARGGSEAPPSHKHGLQLADTRQDAERGKRERGQRERETREAAWRKAKR